MGGPKADVRPTDRPVLLLSVSRGVLSIELDKPFALGPFVLADLALALPSVRFPVDLSGGVSRFRHRRGVLTRLEVLSGLSELSVFVAPRLRGVLGEGTPEMGFAQTNAGLSVGLRLGHAALAFEVVIAPHERDIRLVPLGARGVGLGAPPQVVALRALAEACRPLGRVAGSAVILPDAVGMIVRHVLPIAGGRAPSVAGVRWQAASGDETGLSLSIDLSSAPTQLPAEALRALELVELSAAADEAAMAGDLDEARRRYLMALERAPRHPELSTRLAWIDVVAGERVEAALSTLVDAMPAVDAGILGGELLFALGDEAGSLAAYSNAAHAEPFGSLAAFAWLAVARLAPELGGRLEALDQAVTRAPLLDDARWARLTARLDVGDAQGAKADAEHLEATVRGPEARHAVWAKAAGLFLDRGYVLEARALFERALRYAPDNPEACLGLARSLRAAGEGRRALDVLTRAAALAARARRTLPEVEIEIARGLVEFASDRSAAIARVRAVSPGKPETAEARLLEGRWRAELGDLAGASTAFARLREAAESVSPNDVDRCAFVASMLVEAADIEENAHQDPRAAQRLLGVAVRLRPRDTKIGASFRRLSASFVRVAQPAHAPPAAPPSSTQQRATQEADVEPVSAEEEVAIAVDDEPEEEDEILVERLTDRVRANPHDHEVVLRLADALARLGRDLELLALLSARIEEGGDEVRHELWPRKQQVLAKLAAIARSEGRSSEAELYELMGGEEA